MPDAPPARPATDDGLDPGRPPRSARRTIGWVAAGTFVVATFAMWLYAFFLFDPGLKVDELADRTFPTAAEPICAAAGARLDQLPPANTAKDALERADVVDQADEILRGMLDQLRSVAPTGDDRVSKGISTPAAAALFAASGPATPSMAPWPNSSGLRASLRSV